MSSNNSLIQDLRWTNLAESSLAHGVDHDNSNYVGRYDGLSERQFHADVSLEDKVNRVFQRFMAHPGATNIRFYLATNADAETLVGRLSKLGMESMIGGPDRCLYCQEGRDLYCHTDIECTPSGFEAVVDVDLKKSKAFAILLGRYSRKSEDEVSEKDKPRRIKLPGSRKKQETLEPSGRAQREMLKSELQDVANGTNIHAEELKVESGRVFRFHPVKLEELTAGTLVVRETLKTAPEFAAQALQAALYAGQANEILDECTEDQLDELLVFALQIKCKPLQNVVMVRKLGLSGQSRLEQLRLNRQMVAEADYEAWQSGKHCDGKLIAGDHSLPIHMFKLSKTRAGNLILQQKRSAGAVREIQVGYSRSIRTLQLIAEYVYGKGILVKKLEDNEMADALMASSFLMDDELSDSLAKELVTRFANYASSDRGERKTERALQLMEDVFGVACDVTSEELLSIAFKGALFLGPEYHQALLQTFLKTQEDGVFGRFIPEAKILDA